MRRRSVLLGAAGAPWLLAGCGAGPVAVFPDLASARRRIETLPAGAATTEGWGLAQVLVHAAQSVEFSLAGFPQPKSALFRGTVGALAFTVFDQRGRMSHGLEEPIPGAPALDAATPLPAAVARLSKALADFDAHRGALAPHFAYGALDKAQYTRAHLMHLADHWQRVRIPGDTPA